MGDGAEVVSIPDAESSIFFTLWIPQRWCIDQHIFAFCDFVKVAMKNQRLCSQDLQSTEGLDKCIITVEQHVLKEVLRP